jgi:hypothetical protein
MRSTSKASPAGARNVAPPIRTESPSGNSVAGTSAMS